METENADIEQMRETVAHSDMHALHHVFSVDERGDIWEAIENLQSQIDELFRIVLKIDHE